jgi:predicted metalloendopeptidase
MPAKELPTIAPGIDWGRFLDRAVVGSPEIVVVTTRSSIAGMANLIAQSPLEDWRDYATYRRIGWRSRWPPTSRCPASTSTAG